MTPSTIINVTEAPYNAIGDGLLSTGDDAIIKQALRDAKSTDSFVFLPHGTFYYESEMYEPYNNVPREYEDWRLFGDGVIIGSDIMLSPTVPVGKNQTLKCYKDRTFGRYDSAVGQTITINSGMGQEKKNTPICGTHSPGLVDSYFGRDHVAQFIGASSFEPDVLEGSIEYTQNTVTNVKIPELDIRVGMIIQTVEENPFASIVTGLELANNRIRVQGWHRNDGTTGKIGTPDANTPCIINPNTKIFGQNIIVSATGDGSSTGANHAAGIELSVLTGERDTPAPGTYGIDMALLQGSYIDVGYQIRGKRNISFWSNSAGGKGKVGYLSSNDDRGFVAKDCIYPIEIVKTYTTETGQEERAVFTVSNKGDVTATSLNTAELNGATIKSFDSHVNGEITSMWKKITSIVSPCQGGKALITGFNSSGGKQGMWEILFRVGLVTVSTHSSDGTDLGVEFKMENEDLYMRTTKSPGTLIMKAQITLL